MLLSLSVKTKSKNPGVTKLTDNAYEVRVSKPPIKGRANSEVIDLLAKYFGVHKNQVILKSGHTSANKTVSITPSPHPHHHRHLTRGQNGRSNQDPFRTNGKGVRDEHRD